MQEAIEKMQNLGPLKGVSSGSFGSLAEQDRIRGLQAWLQSFLCPEELQVVALLAHFPASFPEETVLAMHGGPADKQRRAIADILADLRAASVLQPGGKAADGTARYSMQPLVREAAREIFRGLPQQAQMERLRLVKAWLERLEQQALQAHSGRVLADDAASSSMLFGLMAEHGVSLVDDEFLAGMLVLITGLGQRGFYAESFLLAVAVTEVIYRRHGLKNPMALTAISGLASAAYNMGDSGGALVLHELVLDLRPKQEGGYTFPEIWSSANDMALALFGMGENAAAGQLVEGLLEPPEPFFTFLLLDAVEWDPNMQSIFHKIGIAKQKMGNFTAARDIHAKMLSERQKTLGATDPDTLCSSSHLALAESSLGNYTWALRLQKDTLRAQRRSPALGPEHPDTMWTMHNIVGTLLEAGRLVEAAVQCKELLELRQRVLPPNHRDTMMTVNSLAHVQQLLGQHASEAERWQQLLEMQQMQRGAEPASTMHTRVRLATALDAAGQHAAAVSLLVDLEAEALQWAQLGSGKDSVKLDILERLMHLKARLSTCPACIAWQAIQAEGLDVESMQRLPEAMQPLLKGVQPLLEELNAVQKSVLGPMHGETLNSTWVLAVRAHTRSGDATEIHAYQELLEQRQAAHGAEFPDTVERMQDLALFYARYAKDLPRVAHLFEKVLALRLAAPGPRDTVATRACMWNLARAQRLLGQHAGAAAHYEALLALQMEDPGPGSPETLETLTMVASLRASMGNPAIAASLYEQLLVLQSNVDATHASLPEIMGSIAILSTDMGNLTAAVHWYTEALAFVTAAYGPEGPEAATSMSNLGSALAHSGQMAEAEQLLKAAHSLRSKLLGPADALTLRSQKKLIQAQALLGRHPEASRSQRLLLSLQPELVDNMPLREVFVWTGTPQEHYSWMQDSAAGIDFLLLLVGGAVCDCRGVPVGTEGVACHFNNPPALFAGVLLMVNRSIETSSGGGSANHVSSGTSRPQGETQVSCMIMKQLPGSPTRLPECRLLLTMLPGLVFQVRLRLRHLERMLGSNTWLTATFQGMQRPAEGWDFHVSCF